jgi:signal transduction histidine kinase
VLDEAIDQERGLDRALWPTLTVSVTVEDGLSIEVVDNGRGISGDITGSGLTNLRKRAQQVGGDFVIETVSGGGTALRWSAPLP